MLRAEPIHDVSPRDTGLTGVNLSLKQGALAIAPKKFLRSMWDTLKQMALARGNNERDHRWLYRERLLQEAEEKVSDYIGTWDVKMPPPKFSKIPLGM